MKRQPVIEAARYSPAATHIGTRLRVVLYEAKRFGFLGPGPVARHVGHAAGFLGALPEGALAKVSRIADLGSGGGLPGLVVALKYPECRLVLVEASQRRAEFLGFAVSFLGIANRAQVVNRRAEEVGRDVEYRESFDVVVARSFARPAVTAECGAPLLRVGGYIVVSDPPSSGEGNGEKTRAAVDDRWPSSGLSELRMERVESRLGRFSYSVLRSVGNTPDRYPRRTGVPERSPLWG